jgi:hypothetical protein
LPHYEGAAVISAEELIGPEEVGKLGPGRVWVVDMQGGRWGRRVVPVPHPWAVGRRDRFREAYDVQGEVVVVEYQAAPGPAPR